MHDMRQLREISARMARPCVITFLFAMRFALQVLRGERARCGLKGKSIFRGRINGVRKTTKTELGPLAVREFNNEPCFFCCRAREVPSMLVVVRIAALPAPCDARARQFGRAAMVATHSYIASHAEIWKILIPAMKVLCHLRTRTLCRSDHRCAYAFLHRLRMPKHGKSSYLL